MAKRRRTNSRVKPVSRAENPYREVLDTEYPYRYALSRDKRFWEMKNWCKTQLGLEFHAWRIYDLKPRTVDEPDLEWWFKDQGDCMMFRLIWGSAL